MLPLTPLATNATSHSRLPKLATNATSHSPPISCQCWLPMLPVTPLAINVGYQCYLSLPSHRLSMLATKATSHSPPISYQCWLPILPLILLPSAINVGYQCTPQQKRMMHKLMPTYVHRRGSPSACLWPISKSGKIELTCTLYCKSLLVKH